jgi:two-component system OmpR family response regulator
VSSRARLLIVDDDPSIRSAVADYLSEHGYVVETASGAHEMDGWLARGAFDLVILDVMMPFEDGLSICRRLVKTGPPILILSAMGTTADRVLGLELGAADYLPKPFEPRELLARVRAVLRRDSDGAPGRPMVVCGWRFDRESRSATDPRGRAVRLTAQEWQLLMIFLDRPRRLFDRAQIMDLLHGENAGPFDRAIDLAVSRLRRKLPGVGERIETLRGEGYRFNPAPDG